MLLHAPAHLLKDIDEVVMQHSIEKMFTNFKLIYCNIPTFDIFFLKGEGEGYESRFTSFEQAL